MTNKNEIKAYTVKEDIELSNFYFEYDSTTESYCSKCGSETYSVHSNCEGELIETDTIHAGEPCDCCKVKFEFGQDCYTDGEKYLCCDCYNEIKKILPIKIKFMGKEINVSFSDLGTDNKDLYDMANNYLMIRLSDNNWFRVYCYGLYVSGSVVLKCVNLNTMKLMKIKGRNIETIKVLSSKEQKKFTMAILGYENYKKVLKRYRELSPNADDNTANELESYIELAENIENKKAIKWYQYKNITLDDIYNVINK